MLANKGLVLILGSVAAGAAIYALLPDIMRYIKIKTM